VLSYAQARQLRELAFSSEPRQIAVKTINDRLEASITSSASDSYARGLGIITVPEVL
jgi:hypothetical protein